MRVSLCLLYPRVHPDTLSLQALTWCQGPPEKHQQRKVIRGPELRRMMWACGDGLAELSVLLSHQGGGGGPGGWSDGLPNAIPKVLSHHVP